MSVRVFESDEEMFSAMQSDREAVIQTYERMPKFLLEGLKPGHFYVTESCGLVIFGEITESPYEEDRALMKGNPHLREVRGYSVACVEGELGTACVSHMAPISKAAFEQAKKLNWEVQPGVVVGWIELRLNNLRAVAC